jgi:hypothetical protein
MYAFKQTSQYKQDLIKNQQSIREEKGESSRENSPMMYSFENQKWAGYLLNIIF